MALGRFRLWEAGGIRFLLGAVADILLDAWKPIFISLYVLEKSFAPMNVVAFKLDLF